ncbi:MAG: hypothetical protein R3352_09875 [Salinisphaeraceae bacterium]|nr:hypothetical protein [Salinisphaeraceae bacterium]
MSKEHHHNHEQVIKIILSDSLTETVRQLVEQMRDTPGCMEVRKQAVHLLHEAAETNLQFYFLTPASQLRLHSLGIKLLNMGVKTILKLILSVGHKVAGKLSDQQMLYVADFVEEHLLWPEKTPW